MTTNYFRQDLNNILSNKLLLSRKKKKLTQATVAKATGISRTSIVSYENGTSIPDLEKLYKLSEYYGVSFDYLFGKEDETTHDLHYICQQTGLTEKAVKTLFEFVKDKNDNKFCVIFAINKILESKSKDFLLTFAKYLSLPFDLTKDDFNNDVYYYNLYCQRYKVEIPTTMYSLTRNSHTIEYASFNDVVYYELIKKFEELIHTIQNNPEARNEYVEYIRKELQTDYEFDIWDREHSQTQIE